MSSKGNKKKGTKAEDGKADKAGSGTNGSPASTPSNTLVICRNKHWKYISSFHGPWLQLPPEVLESLAYSNYYAPRPRPIDPAVFFDLVKIRRLVDDATNLAVRAASGMASSAFNNGFGNNGLLGRGGADMLGLGIGGSGPTARLSRERKHRMRELATQKLAKAYTLDEIAASVATMQSASTLEEVASLVLQRSPNDPDAKYVHFFHEKIPSRMLAKCTSLQLLDDVIAERPGEGSVLRTKAITKGFKEDWKGAVADLTSALSITRNKYAHHNVPQPQGRRGSGQRLEDDDQPSSLEAQLLFHRACSYLTIACHHIDAALDKPKPAAASPVDTEAPGSSASSVAADATPITPVTPVADPKAAKRAETAKKLLRTNAKRAIRDFLKFLSHFEYCASGPPMPEEHSRSKHSSNGTSDALVLPSPPTSPTSPVLDLATLFTNPSAAHFPPNGEDSQEACTYHPLLTDALHSLLLAHTLLQTPLTELRKHAYTAARLARICDGYPIFLAARSPARADWIEILKGTDNFLGLEVPWEALCAPAPLPSPGSLPSPAGLPAIEGIPGKPQSPGLGPVRVGRKQANEDRGMALAMGKVATEVGNPSMMGNGNASKNALDSAAGRQVLRRWAQEDGREYPVSGERAGIVARWVLEAGVVGKKKVREITAPPAAVPTIQAPVPPAPQTQTAEVVAQ